MGYEYDKYVKVKFSDISKGSYLMINRMMIILEDIIALKPKEVTLLKYILTNKKGALAWDFLHIRAFNPEVVLSQKINIVLYKA